MSRPQRLSPRRLYSPRHGPGVCVECFTFIDPEFERCLVCRGMGRALAAMAPIAYSVHGGALHRDIASYKRDADPSVKDTGARLARVLERFLRVHERCLTAAAGVKRFCYVTVVPSQHTRGPARHPLSRLLSDQVPTVAPRLRELLVRTDTPIRPRRFDPERFIATAELCGEDILLVDDLWASGASAQSAAAALRAAGAGRVAAVVIGRHLNRRRFEPERLLTERAVPLTLEHCVYCAAAPAGGPRAGDRPRAGAKPAAAWATAGRACASAGGASGPSCAVG